MPYIILFSTTLLAQHLLPLFTLPMLDVPHIIDSYGTKCNQTE